MNNLKIILFIGLGALNLLGFFLPLQYGLVIVSVTAVVLIGMELLLRMYSCMLILILLFLHLPDHPTQVLSGFQSTIPYFLIAVMGLGQAVLNSALGKSFFALMSRLLLKTGASLSLLLFLLVIPMALIVSSSTTRNAMLAPLVDQFIERFDLKRDRKAAFLVLGILNTMASSLFLTGGLSALITSKLVGGFSWFRWLVWMAPGYFVLMGLGMVYLSIRYLKNSQQSDDGNMSEMEKIDFPRFNREDWVVSAVLFTVLGLWMTDRWHGLDPLVPALIGLTLIMMLTKYLTWTELKQSSALDLALVVATLFSVVDLMSYYGVLEKFGEHLQSFYHWTEPFGQYGIIGLVILLTIFFNLFIPSIPVCITFLIPLFISGFADIGFNPLFVALTVTMVVDTVKFYPAQSAPLLLAYERKRFTQKDVLFFGMMMSVFILIVIPWGVLPYWEWLAGS